MEIGDLKVAMFAAAKTSLGKSFGSVDEYLRGETDKLADTLLMILEMAAAGETSQRKLKMLLNQQKKASETVLLAAKGMAVNAAQAALNSALAVAKDFINSKTGLPLL